MQPLYLYAVLFSTILPAQILCQLAVGLTQTDYATRDGGQIISIEVSRRGTHQDSIPLQIIPLTLADYETQFPSLPCGSASSLLDDEDPAESRDFNNTIIEQIIPPNLSGFSQSFPFDLTITPDDILEPDEVFLILLNFADETGIDIGRRCAVGRIQGSNNARINFLQVTTQLSADTANVRLRERAENFVLFNVMKIVESELIIELTVRVTSINAFGGLDFAVSNTRFIAPDESLGQVNITLFDDELAEATELYDILLEADVIGISTEQSVTTRLEIIDNDVVQLGFVTDEEVTIFEGERFQLCAGLKNLTVRNFYRQADAFQISTIDGSAKAGDDYTARAVIFRPIVRSPMCYTFLSTENDLVNDPRYFTVSFDTSQENALTIIQPSSIRVNIIDNDALPLAPEILEIKSITDKTLIITWRADTTPQRPITGFYGNITASPSKGDGFAEFNSSMTTYELPGFQKNKTYYVVICSENVNGRNCSSDLLTMPTPKAVGVVTPTKLPPGLIAGVVVVVVVLLLFCCLVLLLLFLCLYCRTEREKSYFPAKAEKRELRGKSVDSISSFDEEEFSYSPESPKTAL